MYNRNRRQGRERERLAMMKRPTDTVIHIHSIHHEVEGGGGNERVLQCHEKELLNINGMCNPILLQYFLKLN